MRSTPSCLVENDCAGAAAVFGGQRFGFESEKSAVLEVDGGEIVDEELGVGSALPELNLNDQFGGVLKDSPSRGSQSHTWAWPVRGRLFLAIALSSSVGQAFQPDSSVRQAGKPDLRCRHRSRERCWDGP